MKPWQTDSYFLCLSSFHFNSFVLFRFVLFLCSLIRANKNYFVWILQTPCWIRDLWTLSMGFLSCVIRDEARKKNIGTIVLEENIWNSVFRNGCRVCVRLGWLTFLKKVHIAIFIFFEKEKNRNLYGILQAGPVLVGSVDFLLFSFFSLFSLFSHFFSKKNGKTPKSP